MSDHDTMGAENNQENEEDKFYSLQSFDAKLLHKEKNDLDEFLDADEGSLLVAGGEVNFFYPPLFFSIADRIFFHTKYWRGHTPQIGRRPNETRFLKARNKIVTGVRGMEGLIFDNATVFKGMNSVNVPKNPHPFKKSGRNVMIEKAAIAEVPFLHGRYIVGYNGVCHNYYHSITECMIPIFMMAQLDLEAKILFPRSLEQCVDVPHMQILKRTINVDRLVYYEDFVKVEEVLWVHGDDVSQIAPSQYIAFRQHTLSNETGFDDISATKEELPNQRASIGKTGVILTNELNIYVKRRGTRSIYNSDEAEKILSKYNFVTYFLEDMDYHSQIILFSGARNIISCHGAGLTNLIFSAPGTNVIELAPNSEFRPFFWMISEKMSLNYTVLACETDVNDFNGKLIVDVVQLEVALTALARYA